MQEKIKILESFLGAPYKIKEEFLFRCPKCDHHKKKLSVNIAKDVFKCWICDYSGKTIKTLIKRFAKSEDYSRWAELSGEIEIRDFDLLFSPKEEKKREQLNLPDSFISLTNRSLPASAKLAIEYLAQRGIDKGKIKKHKIGYCPSGRYRDRVIIPSFDSEGFLNYFVSRAYKGSGAKYINPPTTKDVIFGELNIDWTRDIVIVEGVFDSIEVENSIPILGSTVRENSLLFKRIVESGVGVYVALDPDAALKSYAITKLFDSYGVRVKQVKLTGDSDISELGSEGFKLLKNQSNFLDKNDYLLYKISTL